MTHKLREWKMRLFSLFLDLQNDKNFISNLDKILVVRPVGSQNHDLVREVKHTVPYKFLLCMCTFPSLPFRPTSEGRQRRLYTIGTSFPPKTMKEKKKTMHGAGIFSQTNLELKTSALESNPCSPAVNPCAP
jgi:hypothetical protein